MAISTYEEYQIESLSQFLEHLPEQHVEKPWGYRGQRKVSWKLEPSLLRGLVDLASIPEPEKKAWKLKKLETLLLMRYKAYAQPHLTVVPNSDLAWLALAQHHGLPTRLLDWSENPLVALLFALEEDCMAQYESHCGDSQCEPTIEDSVVWAVLTENALIENEKTLHSLDKELIEKCDPTSHLLSVSLADLRGTLYRYHPSHTTSRITAQQGFFTVQQFWGLTRGIAGLEPLEEAFGFDPTFSRVDPDGPWARKYIIPHDAKDHIKKELDTFGMNEYAVYPDLEGAAKKLHKDIRLGKKF